MARGKEIRGLGKLDIMVTQTDQDLALIGFCDDASQPAKTLILSRMVVTSADDAADDDGPYIEIDGQENSQYGGIDTVTIAGDRVEIVFLPDSSLAKTCAGVTFTCDAPQFASAADFIDGKIGLRVRRTRG